MRKIAIFVEGNTELVFIRRYLQMNFEYEDLEVECRKRQFGRFDEVPFSIKDAQNPKYHFRIIDSGTDARVLDDILEDEQLLYNYGYQRIIGLRDMFSENYIKEVKQPRKIKPELNQKFIDRFQARINREAKKPESISFCFAIMEIETWFLAIPKIWEKKGISNEVILRELGYDLSKIDPEVTFFHPAIEISKILTLNIVEKDYKKHASEVEKIVGQIEKQDFEDLQNSQKCNSFKEFTSNITIN